jgi:hypothetical protein
MFSGPPLPLPPELPLIQLRGYAQMPGILGAWVRGCAHKLRIVDSAGARQILVSSDLGLLLGRCNRVALREGQEPVVLEVEVVIQWRTLQIVTATPYLPGLDRLSVLFPGLRSGPTGLMVPILTRSPEEVLAECLSHGMQVNGSRVVYSVSPD